jgi:AcrR family transcriptional regulator
MTLKAQPNPAIRLKLTRDRVIEAALQLMDEEGLEAVTMRAVARVLGVEAMSLYNHVHDKEDLMDGIIDLVMKGFRPPSHRDDWLEAAREAVREWRRLLKAHPPMIQLLAEHSKPMTTLAALDCVECALEPLMRAGLTPREAANAFHTFGGYIFGFVLMETRQTFGGPEGEGATPESLRALISDVQRLPTVAAVFPDMCSTDAEEQFEFGLDLLLMGLQAKIAAKS